MECSHLRALSPPTRFSGTQSLGLVLPDLSVWQEAGREFLVPVCGNRLRPAVKPGGRGRGSEGAPLRGSNLKARHPAAQVNPRPFEGQPCQPLARPEWVWSEALFLKVES